MVLMLSLRSRTSHGQGHLKVTVILRSRSFWNQMVMCFEFYPQAGGWLSSECLFFLLIIILEYINTCRSEYDSKNVHRFLAFMFLFSRFISRILFQFESGECFYFVYPSELLKKVFGVVLFFLEFFMPLIILVFCYGKIVRILSKRLSFNTNSGNLYSDKFQLAKTNTIKTMFIVALFFIICLSNTQIYYLITNLGFKADWDGPYYQFTMIMSFLNCTVNPFIYLIKYQDFHKALLKSLACVKLYQDNESEIRCSTLSTSLRV